MLSKIYNYLVLSYSNLKTSQKVFLFVMQLAAIGIVFMSLIVILNVLFWVI